jgi:hypothetical protein
MWLLMHFLHGYVLGCQPHIYKYIFLFDFDLFPFNYAHTLILEPGLPGSNKGGNYEMFWYNILVVNVINWNITRLEKVKL